MNVTLIAGAFGLGASIAILPGPVQLLLLTEASRGGMRRGFAAMAGANGTFGALLMVFAAGAAFLAPDQTVLRILKVTGGVFLLFLAADAISMSWRASSGHEDAADGRVPVLRGVVAVLLNPGAWIFMATTATSLFAAAAHSGGRPLALASAVVMVAGIACVDGPMVLLGGGMRRFERGLALSLVPILAVALAGFGVLLVVQGLRG